jgi:pilus assembly protein CpaB
MRSLRGLAMIGIALILGLVAAVLAARLLMQQSNISTSKLAVANVDLNVGQRITADQIRMTEWPAASLPKGAFSKPELLTGRVARTAIQRDEPLLEARLAPVGARGGLSAVIAEGKRAITVRVNDVVGVAGYALPGNFVDVIVNTKEDSGGKSGKEEQSVSKIVLEKILVLAIGQEASRDDTKPRVVNAVTLEVSPLEAEKIDLARSVGTLSLVLRNQVDSNANQAKGATKDSLLGVAPEPKPSPAPAVTRVVVRRPATIAAAPAAPPVVVSAPEPRISCIDAFVGGERRSECFTQGARQ